MRTRTDLAGLPGFADLDVDTCGNPCVWRNHYACDCPDGPESAWDMEWSCHCDDACPECGAICSPYESIWIGASDERLRALWETLPEGGSAEPA